MKNSTQPSMDTILQRRVIEIAIRVVLLALVAIWCFMIFKPFLIPLIWAIIIAVAVYPPYKKLQIALGGRAGLASAIFMILALSLIIIPTIMFSGSIIDSGKKISENLKNETITISPPPEKVGTWPVIGPPVADFWQNASENLQSAIEKILPLLKKMGGVLLSAITGLALGILQFIISIIIAGVLLANAAGGHQTAKKVLNRLLGKKGTEFVTISSATIRSVAQGVLGVAVIQSLLAGIGFLAAGVPGAGIWALLVLISAVIQLPALLVLGPIIIYVFSVASTGVAVVFMIWSLLVGVSDTILKPLFLGRGMDIPTLVILIGAIGGMMLSGIIGLFVGAVVLALSYKLFLSWLTEEAQPLATNGESLNQ